MTTSGTAKNYRTGGIIGVINHQIEIGDPDITVAWCKDCSWRVKSDSRNKLRAESYRHIADILDPPQGA